jgi:hypothetical protein
VSITTAFQPQGLTLAFVTSGTINTAASTQITPQNLGFPANQQNFPPNVWVVNAGTVGVWVSFTPATATIVVPTAGSPTQAMLVLPNQYIAWTVIVGPALWVNSISGTASQPFYVTFGEGMI